MCRMVRFLVAVGVVGHLIVASVAPAHAATYYVDGSPTGCNASACSDANDGLTESTAFATPSGCFDRMSGGDTCLIKNGTYLGAGPNRYTPYFNVCDGPNGNPGNLTTYKAYPGHQPLFCADADCTAGQDPQLGASDLASPCEHIQIQGLHVDGAFTLWGTGPGTTVRNIVVTENEFEGGYDCDGNYAPVRLERVTGITFDRNYVHGLDAAGCEGSHSGIHMFCVHDSVIEYNTVVNDGDLFKSAIYPKDSPVNLTIRNNYTESQIRINNQNNCGIARDVEVYGNVVKGDIAAVVRVDDASIHHNTLIDGTIKFNSHPIDPAWTGATVRDNLVQQSDQSFMVSTNHWQQLDGHQFDYNVYEPGSTYRADAYGQSDQVAESIELWRTRVDQAGCVSCEENSRELDVVFTPGNDTDYHLAAGSPARTSASNGGEVGAYGVTDCVGFTCDRIPGCADGFDNDNDGLVDGDDPGCVDAEDFFETGSHVCDDGVDNDGDGLADHRLFGGDPGCSGPTDGDERNASGPACDNGVDDDSDTAADYPQDPGCDGPTDANEKGTAECDDGIDNDDDQLIDYPSDTDCSSPAGSSEAESQAELISCDSPDLLVCSDFEDGSLDYWNDDLETQEDRLVATSEASYGGEFAARVQHVEGQATTAWGAKFFGGHPLGDPASPVDEIYVSARARFSSGFDFSSPVKISITAAFEAWDAGYPGPNSWAAFYATTYVMSDGKFKMEVNRKTSGIEQWRQFPQNQNNDRVVQGNVWHEIQWHLKLNTPGQSDGLLEYWVDGVLVARYTDVNFRDTYQAHRWNHLLGISANAPVAPTNQAQYWDDIVASGSPINFGEGSVPAVTNLHRTDK